MKRSRLTRKQRQLVEENHALAYHYAYKTIKQCYIFPEYEEELIHECLTALCTAAMTYNPSVAKFSTYAVNTMKLKTRHLRQYILSPKRKAITTRGQVGDTDTRLAMWDHNNASYGEYDQIDVKDELKYLRRFVNAQQWKAISLRYLKGYSYQEIGAKMNMTKSGIERCIKAGFYAMRNKKKSKKAGRPKQKVS